MRMIEMLEQKHIPVKQEILENNCSTRLKVTSFVPVQVYLFVYLFIDLFFFKSIVVAEPYTETH